MTTNSLFLKRPLVETVKRKLMLHQETKLKHPQLKCLSHKTAESVKCQNLLVIQVSKNMICFSCYCPWEHLGGGLGGGGGCGVIVTTLKGGFSYRTCHLATSAILQCLLIVIVYSDFKTTCYLELPKNCKSAGDRLKLHSKDEDRK